MKIALICPSNKMYMPYLRNYQSILDDTNVKYEILNWDRFSIEETEGVYRDFKTGHRRNFYDYYKFSRHIVKKLEKGKYDRVIIFGIQLVFFLGKYLRKHFPNKYIFDIRDYNKVIKLFNIASSIENSYTTVLSSPGFTMWLPNSSRYTINHNTNIGRVDSDNTVGNDLSNIKISYIGSIRDYEINSRFIKAIDNSKKISIVYNGDGVDLNRLKEYVKEESIDNVFFTGRYSKDEEKDLYFSADLVNVLVPNDDINSRTLLPNRLYNSIINKKPVLAYKGTYLSEIVEEYKLGLIVDNFENLEASIVEYLENVKNSDFINNCSIFMDKVLDDNNIFESKIIDFISIKDDYNV